MLLTETERVRLRSALKNNSEHLGTINIGSDTQFMGTDGASESLPDFITKLSAAPLHY